MQHLPDGERGHRGQAVGRGAQGFFQEVEGPGGGAIVLGGGLTLYLAEDAGAGVGGVGGLAPAAVTQGQSPQAEVVETRHQGGDGVATLASQRACRLLVIGAASNGQEETSAGDLEGRGGGSATEAREGVALLGGQRAQRILLAAGHGLAPYRIQVVLSRHDEYGYRGGK